MVDAVMTRHIRNFCWLIVGLLLGAVASFSFAADGTDAGAPKVQKYNPRWYVQVASWPNGARVDSSDAACSALNGYITPAPNPPYTSYTNGANAYRCYRSGASVSDAMNYGLVVGRDCSGLAGTTYNSSTGTCDSGANQCPIGSTLQGSTCTCNSGLVFYDGMCKTPVCTSTAQASNGYFDMGPSPTDPPAVACVNGCLAVYSGTGVQFSKLVNGQRRYYAKGAYDFSGAGSADRCTANPAPSSSSSLPADTCPPGQVKFTVNGNAGCVSASTGQTTTPPPTKTTTNTSVTNADGSTTVTTKTTDQATGQTTTSTSTYPPGVTPPVLPGTTVTPSSGAGQDSSGDKDACEDDPQRVGCKHLDEILGEVPSPEPINTSEQSVAFNPAAGFGSGSYSCPQNPKVLIHQTGQNIDAFDYGPTCSFADGIKPVVLAFAFLGAALIGIGGAKD